MDSTSSAAPFRLSEAMACLGLATDLAVGQPLEHSLRRTLIATWLGEEAGLNAEDLGDVYYVALLGSVGCVVNTAAIANFVRNEIALRREIFTLDLSKPLPTLSYMVRRAGEGEAPPQKLRKFIGLASQGPSIFRDVALHVGGMLDLGPAIRQALGQCDEHWNGKGGVLGLKGEAISLPARLFLLAQDVDVFSRAGGLEATLSVIRQRSGEYYDPQLVELFCRVGPGLLQRLDSISTWDATQAAEPQPVRQLSPPDVQAVARRIARFIDVRSPYMVGHSGAVADVAEAAALKLGLSEQEASWVGLAGLFHDLGRMGIPVTVWNKKQPLSTEERGQIERHPSLTELLLARTPALGPLASTAGLHHE